MRFSKTAVVLGGVGIAGLARAELRPQSDLTSDCYNFPKNNFDAYNSIKGVYGTSPHMPLETGADAIDFTLHDLQGNSWNLGEQLKAGEGKPVVLIWGMSTCPAYQGYNSAGSSYRWTYWHEHALVSSHGEKAIFVHMYGPEPHPTVPDTNFDSGTLLPNYWSVASQTLTYEGRVASAEAIRSITHPSEVILPDYLPDNPFSNLNQPGWCSYAQGARSSVMISSQGTVFYQQDWLNTDDLGDAIDGYWAQGGKGFWDTGGNVGPFGASPKTARREKQAIVRGKTETEQP